MLVKVPEFKRCCCCLPLRRGLLLWMYLKPIFGLMWFAYMYNIGYFFEVATFIFVTDVIFCILFLISAHRKNPKLMRIYCYYASFMLIIAAFGLLGWIGLGMYIYEMMIISVISGLIFLHLVLQAYLVLLVRSEVLKLERNSEVELINYTTEPDCKAAIMI